MNNLKLANLVELCSESELDGICFQEEGLEEFEESPFKRYIQEIENQIQYELRGSRFSHHFLRYSWHGFSEQLPWSENHNVPFDPRLTSVVIPFTNQLLLQIMGEDRRIVLTQPPTYGGERPFYHVVCSSERQIDNVRVLNDGTLRPFYNLEKVFTSDGFESLPKLKDVERAGIISPSREQLVVPGNSSAYF